MKQFHKELNKVQKDLQYSELLELFDAYKASHKQEIKDKIFNANIKLVFSIVSKYKNLKGIGIDEVQHFGFIGLVCAINHFDPSKNIRFSTYATRVITNEINNGLNLYTGVIPIPKHLYKKVKSEEIQQITTSDLESIQLETETTDIDIDKKIDSQIFWQLLHKYCTIEEIDILIKMYCSEHETKLINVARSIGQTKQYTFNKLQKIIKRLKENEVFKNNIRDTSI